MEEYLKTHKKKSKKLWILEIWCQTSLQKNYKILGKVQFDLSDILIF